MFEIVCVDSLTFLLINVDEGALVASDVGLHIAIERCFLWQNTQGPNWMGECMESVLYHIIYIHTVLDDQ
jgi:hypothetical protein